MLSTISMINFKELHILRVPLGRFTNIIHSWSLMSIEDNLAAVIFFFFSVQSQLYLELRVMLLSYEELDKLDQFSAYNEVKDYRNNKQN